MCCVPALFIVIAAVYSSVAVLFDAIKDTAADAVAGFITSGSESKNS